MTAQIECALIGAYTVLSLTLWQERLQLVDIKERPNPEEESAKTREMKTMSMIIETIERINKYFT